MQRSKWNTFFDTVDNFVSNQNGFAVQFAATYHAVTDGADAAVEAVGFEFVHQGFYRAGMVWLGSQFNFMFFAVEFEGDVGIRQIEFFCQAAQQYFAAVIVQYSTLEGRAAAVQNQD